MIDSTSLGRAANRAAAREVIEALRPSCGESRPLRRRAAELCAALRSRQGPPPRPSIDVADQAGWYTPVFEQLAALDDEGDR